MSNDVEAIWRALFDTLRNNEDVPASVRGFLSLVIPKGVMGGTIYLEVANDYTRSTIEQRARNPLLDAIGKLDNPEVVNFAVIVNPEVDPVPASTPPSYEAEPSQGATDAAETALHQTAFTDISTSYPQPAATEAPADVTPSRSSPLLHLDDTDQAIPHDSRLNERYTFDNYVIGSSNRFAHAAAVAVAEAPARSYNPLFIYGGSGLGKTHLLHAIGNYAESMYPGIRVRYVSSEEFTNDFINSIANNKGQQFHARYRSNDILLIDDIQFLQGKDSTVEAFFYTFNTLHQHKKQVVITSDEPPKKLTGFEERMVSRFEWGLITDVQSPDLETRIAILRKKAEADNVPIPDEAIEFIAAHVTGSIRELEGTLIRVTAFANLNRQPIDLSLVTTVLKDLIIDVEPQIVTPDDIISITADYFRVSTDEIFGSSRSHAIANVRQVAMYLCREMTSLSLPKIGQLFGGRDHTTVMYAHRKISKRISDDRQLYNQVTELTSRIRQTR